MAQAIIDKAAISDCIAKRTEVTVEFSWIGTLLRRNAIISSVGPNHVEFRGGISTPIGILDRLEFVETGRMVSHISAGERRLFDNTENVRAFLRHGTSLADMLRATFGEPTGVEKAATATT